MSINKRPQWDMEGKMIYEFEVEGDINGKGRPRVNTYTGHAYTWKICRFDCTTCYKQRLLYGYVG